LGIVMVLVGVAAAIVALTSHAPATPSIGDLFAGITGIAAYIVVVIGFVFGYRLLLGSFNTFGQRDELLMRIDVAHEYCHYCRSNRQPDPR
jgi:hypothetical protein